MPGCKVFAEDFFYSVAYSLVGRCFSLEQMSDNNQTDQKVINVSNRSVSCRKITQKVDKSFCRENFSLYHVENLFPRPGQRRNVLSRNMPAKFQGRAIFVPGVFSKRRSLNDDGQTFSPPPPTPSRSLSLAALLRITCCCYVFMACPRDSMANSAARQSCLFSHCAT